MLCPICLRTVASFQQFSASGSPEVGYRCPECKQIVPPRYIIDYAEYPPVVMNLIGHRGHGKTVYLAGLLLAMRRWSARGFSYQPLDEAALRDSRLRTDELQNRKVPESTPVAFREPTIVRIHPWGEMSGCHLIIYDGGGEAFEQTATLIRNRDYLARSTTVIWLLSLKNLEQPEDELMHLQAVYADAVSRLQGNTRSQYLVVVLTKADLLIGEPSLPGEVREFLLGNEEEIHSHIEKLAELSDAIEEWLESVPQYANFAHTARQNFAEVRYCVVSATGSRPEENRLKDDANPTGVLTPIYWLQNFQIPHVTVHLPADAQADSKRGLSRPPVEVYRSLEEAIEKAPADSHIDLTAGDYYLRNRLIVDKPLAITGIPGQTRVIGSGGEFLLKVIASGRVAVAHVDFLRRGDEPGDVATVAQGSPEFRLCSFSGAVTQVVNGQVIAGGCGMMIEGSAAPAISGCKLSNNRRAGIFVKDQARPTIENCTIDSNACGLYYEGTASGKAVRNRCDGNSSSGMCIKGHASPVLEGNTCNHNAAYGIEIAAKTQPIIGEQKMVFEQNTLGSVEDMRVNPATVWRAFRQWASPVIAGVRSSINNRNS